MIKYCETCRLHEKTKKICLLTGIPMKDTDYCSKHANEIIVCDICGNPLLSPTYVEYDCDGILRQYCERCHQAFQTCQLCPKFQKCEFMTNPDPMPQVIMKTVRQGNMVMQAQVKNEKRVQKFCPSCCCWDENHGCMKEFNIGCTNRPDFYNTRESSEN